MYLALCSTFQIQHLPFLLRFFPLLHVVGPSFPARSGAGCRDDLCSGTGVCVGDGYAEFGSDWNTFCPWDELMFILEF